MFFYYAGEQQVHSMSHSQLFLREFFSSADLKREFKKLKGGKMLLTLRVAPSNTAYEKEEEPKQQSSPHSGWPVQLRCRWRSCKD